MTAESMEAVQPMMLRTSARVGRSGRHRGFDPMLDIFLDLYLGYRSATWISACYEAERINRTASGWRVDPYRIPDSKLWTLVVSET